jgi:solute carrier family 25 protein 39/40
MGGFFTGLKVSLIRDVPFSGIFFPIYEICKKFYSLMLFYNPNDETSKKKLLFYTTLVSSLSSITANLMSCVITHPLDIIRTRVFFQYYNKD